MGREYDWYVHISGKFSSTATPKLSKLLHHVICGEYPCHCQCSTTLRSFVQRCSTSAPMAANPAKSSLWKRYVQKLS